MRPWLRSGHLLGFVELGVDVPAFLQHIKESSGDELGMLLAKPLLDRHEWGALAGVADRWESRSELVVVETTTGDEKMLGGLDRLADVPERPEVLEQLSLAGRSLVRGVFPLRGEDGAKVGAVVVLHDVTALREGVRELRGRVVVLVAMLAAGLGALLVFLLETLVFERLARMTRVLEELPERLARGEYEIEDGEPGPVREDEIGKFERFFRRALREVGSFVSDVRRERSVRARRPPD